MGDKDTVGVASVLGKRGDRSVEGSNNSVSNNRVEEFDKNKKMRGTAAEGKGESVDGIGRTEATGPWGAGKLAGANGGAHQES